jgi:hypothetical protein
VTNRRPNALQRKKERKKEQYVRRRVRDFINAHQNARLDNRSSFLLYTAKPRQLPPNVLDQSLAIFSTNHLLGRENTHVQRGVPDCSLDIKGMLFWVSPMSQTQIGDVHTKYTAVTLSLTSSFGASKPACGVCFTLATSSSH